MSYRVEVATTRRPEYSEEGPICMHFETATMMLEDILADPEPGLLGVRIRDTARDPRQYNPIVVSVERPHGR